MPKEAQAESIARAHKLIYDKAAQDAQAKEDKKKMLGPPQAAA
jgi:hypothetical protein